MPRELKVWRARLYAHAGDVAEAPVEIQEYAAKHRGAITTVDIVAAPSRSAAGKAMGLRPHEFDGCCLGETASDASVAQALTEPGTVFWKPADYRGPVYARRRERS